MINRNLEGLKLGIEWVAMECIIYIPWLQLAAREQHKTAQQPTYAILPTKQQPHSHVMDKNAELQITRGNRDELLIFQ